MIGVEQLVFEAPWAIALLALVPAVLLLRRRRGRRAALPFGATARAAAAGASLRQRLAWMPAALRIAALMLLIVALARPQSGVGQTRTVARGVAIMAVVDRSYSMTQPMAYDGAQLSRLEVVQRVFREFVEGNGAELDGRPEDMIGLVQFAGFAETACPLVRIHSTLVDVVERIPLAPTSGFEAGTRIGEGLGLAAARLREAEADLAGREALVTDAADAPAGDPDFEITSKIIILLSDGEETTRPGDGRMLATEAAELCRAWGIKIYCIGIGGPDEGRGLLRRGMGFDEGLLRFLAAETGGIYRRAADAEALRAVYREIDELEKTEIESFEFTAYEELFAWPAGAAAALLALEALLATLLLRRAA